MAGWFYMMTNRKNGTLYGGSAVDLVRRAWEHREGVIDGFTKKYGLKRLVYFERYDDVREARRREEAVKHLATRLEGAVDPFDEPGMGRSLRSPAVKTWIPGTSPGPGILG
jgi:putative endonuclease